MYTTFIKEGYIRKNKGRITTKENRIFSILKRNTIDRKYGLNISEEIRF